MQAITALAHLHSCVLFFLDISESCTYSIKQQVGLFHSIKPLFANKVSDARAPLYSAPTISRRFVVVDVSSLFIAHTSQSASNRHPCGVCREGDVDSIRTHAPAHLCLSFFI
jgi:hypothetical protein